MARKSRKQNNQPILLNHEPPYIQAAAYLRLSVEDRAEKGTSIETQQQIIENYIADNPEFKLYDTYVDVGVSGATYERPGFQRMIRDAEAGKIRCIIVKDLSRLGRNVIDTGYYADKVFPQLGIRLISITDNYDSDIPSDGITLPLINLMNEAYLFDIRRKTKSQSRQAMKDGMYVGGRPPYGYMRSPENHHKLILDESVSEIVRQIFRWANDNINITEIARRLNGDKVPSPKRHNDSTEPGVWYASTVNKILGNEIYLGHLIQGKTEVINFERQTASVDDWIHTYDTHEAIVSPEIFQAVQIIRKKVREETKSRPAVTYSLNIFRGKIFCAHCGNRLERKRNHDKYIFRCVANRNAPDSCAGNRIGEDIVSREISKQLLQLKDMFSKEPTTPLKETDALSELNFIGMELARLQDITRSLYENLVSGVIDRIDYDELKSGYQSKVDELKQRETELQQQIFNRRDSQIQIKQVIDVLGAFDETTALNKDKDIVDQFVDRLEVFRDGRVHVVWGLDSRMSVFDAMNKENY